MRPIQKKYLLWTSIWVILAVLSFGVYLYAVTQMEARNALWLFIPILVSVIVVRMSQESFYRRGYYRDKQALLFYEKCRENGFVNINKNNLSQVEKIYHETVSTADFTDRSKEAELFNEIYLKGKKIKESKR